MIDMVRLSVIAIPGKWHKIIKIKKFFCRTRNQDTEPVEQGWRRNER